MLPLLYDADGISCWKFKRGVRTNRCSGARVCESRAGSSISTEHQCHVRRRGGERRQLRRRNNLLHAESDGVRVGVISRDGQVQLDGAHEPWRVTSFEHAAHVFLGECRVIDLDLQP